MSPSTPSLTLTSVLNSLHSHLQSQTQLLPTLHLQLGLPHTALEDELKSIQQQLMQSVESQINLRRNQVDQWMKKCEVVENECIQYGRALGGYAKATGSSVGELRKEQVLPRRYELVSEYQEKMRQLYHTKLEQLTTLTNRLRVLSKTLGPDFFPQDIINPLLIGDDAGSDNRDVTPERFSRLEKELVRGKGEVAKRLSQLSSTMIQIDWLYIELGIEPPTLGDLPSSSKLLSVSSGRRTLSLSTSSSGVSTDPFLSASVSTPTPSSRTSKIAPLLFASTPSPPDLTEADCQRIFAQFVARIEEADDENLNADIGLEGVEPTESLISWAQSTMASLEDIKRRREARIQTMYDQLECLWRRLGVADEDMDGFVEAHRGSTEETVRKYEEELERMLELKRERMGVFIENARGEIETLWDTLMVGEEERLDFAPFADDEHTEELLSIHEEEIRRLKDERRMKAPLLAAIKKYFEICEEEKELAAAASDQSRLLGRGPRDPGRLLREEKMRKRVNKEKPRLEQDLLVSIPAWEDETGRQFLVHGESIVRILMEATYTVDQENQNKRKQIPNRAGTVPPRATTPAYVPGIRSVTGVVTPAVRSGSSLSKSAPSKRPRLGESGSKPAPLGTHRGQYAVNGSVGNRPASATTGKTPSSLPRPVGIPKSGMVQGVPYGYRHQQAASNALSVSTSSYRYGAGAGIDVAKKASRARRESFKPRASVDENGSSWPGSGTGMGRRGFVGMPVKEEDEGY